MKYTIYANKTFLVALTQEQKEERETAFFEKGYVKIGEEKTLKDCKKYGIVNYIKNGCVKSTSGKCI